MKDLEREKEKFQKELNNRSVDVDSIKEDFWKQKTLLEGEIAHHKQTINKLEEELRKNVSTNSIVASPEATPQQANPNQSGNDELEDLKSRYDSDLHAKDYIISSLREQVCDNSQG
jgi:Skp family chaperone for outer membrane proteins